MRITKQLIRQVLFYGIIGSCGALLDLIVFYFLYDKLSINEFIANIASVHCGIALSFILNRKYNFKKTDHVAFRAISFYLTGLFGLALSVGFLWLGGYLELPIMWVKVASIFIVAAVQFMINKLVTFGKIGEKKKDG
jgi:putative flippase GtrA